MNVDWIIPVFVLIDDMFLAVDHRTDSRASVPDSEIVLIAIVAAQYVHTHHERAVCMLKHTKYRSGTISVSRFNRRIRQLAAWLPSILQILGMLAELDGVVIIDSMPIPVCTRVRSRRCTKIQGQPFSGFCSAKDEKFFGWRLHLVCTPTGVPIAYQRAPASIHAVTLAYGLTVDLPPGTCVVADKGYVSAALAARLATDANVRMLAARRKNMRPHEPEDAACIRAHRYRIESVHSQLERMDIEDLYARTNDGMDIKILSSLIAVAWTNLN